MAQGARGPARESGRTGERGRTGDPGRTRNQVLLVAAFAVLVAAFLSVAAVGHNFFDLRVYHGAINYWAHGDGEIYDWLKPNSRYGFTYPPFAALLMLPLAYLPWHLVVVLSVAASAAAILLLLWWLVDPVARRQGWPRWFTLAIAFGLAAAFEPTRETVDFGQVNALLLALVAADLLCLVARGSRWGGVGVGLATAIKLTPGIFIVYLLVTGRWRAALTASGTAAAATVLAGALAPNATREFWTDALWNTNRVGSLSFISNQSWQGVVARLDPAEPSTLAWLALVVATLAVWAVRVRRAIPAGPPAGAAQRSPRSSGPAPAQSPSSSSTPTPARVGDEAAGLALTGVVGSLISPVTWVHHLVWLLPALILLVDHAYRAPAGSSRRRRLLGFAIVAYLVLISRLVWIWERDFSGVIGFLGSNAYVWISLALLVLLPIGGQPVDAGERLGATGGRRAGNVGRVG